MFGHTPRTKPTYRVVLHTSYGDRYTYLHADTGDEAKKVAVEQFTASNPAAKVSSADTTRC